MLPKLGKNYQERVYIYMCVCVCACVCVCVCVYRRGFWFNLTSAEVHHKEAPLVRIQSAHSESYKSVRVSICHHYEWFDAQSAETSEMKSDVKIP